MRLLNAPSYADLPNVAYPYLGSNRAGYLGATGLPNPWLLRVMPDTALWQNHVQAYNADPRYGIVASVGTCGVNIGVPTTGTFIDLGPASRFHTGSWGRTEPRANYPMRPIIAGAAAARVNPALSWYNAGYVSNIQSSQDLLSAVLAKPGFGGYSG